MKAKKILLFAFLLIGIVACKYDDDALWDKVNSLDDRITSIEKQLTQANSDISAISVAINALQNNIYVSDVQEVGNGFVITFTDGEKITIKNGTNGQTPYIGENGNWWIGNHDTGVTAEGKDGADGTDGLTPYIGENGNWWIGNHDTGVKAEGKDGADGTDGQTPYIGENGNWWIGDHDTGVRAEGKDGTDGRTPYIGKNGNWWIGHYDTGVKAEGKDAPVISVEEFKGKYYWVQIYKGKQTWLTDKNGNKLPVTGTNGITPILRVNAAGYWIISYDRGITFIELLDENNNPIKAVGQNGQDGQDGDSFFSQVKVENGILILILTDGTELRIPLDNPIYLKTKITINPTGIEHATFKDCYIVSFNDSIRISQGKDLYIQAFANELPQSFFITKDDDIYMIGRSPVKKGEPIEISARTTALAMVTWQPLFSPIKGNEYKQLIELITNSPKFQTFYEEVVLTINANKNLFDENNTELLRKFSDLTEDICGNIDINNGSFNGEITPIAASRAIYENAKIYPFYAEIDRNKLTLRNTGLTPTYYGTVTHANGSENISVQARSDYGGFDMFKTIGEINLGPKSNYLFSHEGEYQFYLSRMSPAATADFYLRLANCVLTSLGLQLGNDIVQELGNSISRAMINAGSGVDDDTIDPTAWFGIAYNATLEYLKNSPIFEDVLLSFKFAGQFLSGSLNFYNKIKGIGNAATRISYALSAPKEVEFCLCYYNQEITTCTEASLYKVNGDRQVGYANQRLLLPITVGVSTLGDDGIYHPASSYHRVKFEVISGNGKVESELVSADNENQASTYWVLGENKEEKQKVKATVVDIITNKEISEPVYFTASMSDAAVTVRLDWSQHSGRTDIDLHVVDPSGEEIYFAHMNSASGGYLDRDDRVGPGPEHIRWSNAPAGTYKIYVHYYPNGDADKSIVSYKVSVNTSDKSYHPVSGSISYNQLVPIGQFTIGEESDSSRSTQPATLDSTAPIQLQNYPKKNIFK